MSKNSIFKAGNKFLIPYLAFLGAFPPLATDMYLPALPTMGASLGVDNELTGYTISVFFLFFATSMLLWGPLSDRYGRKPVLIAGTLLFSIASAAIAMSCSIGILIFWRAIQAMGSAAAVSISLAIVKDTLRGKVMERVVSIMQAATVLAPMSAPVIGGALLMATSWRGIFWCLMLCGLLALAGTFFLAETGRSRNASLLETFTRFGKVLVLRSFLWPMIIFSALAMPFFSYLGVSSFIYQESFQVSAQNYSLFFAMIAATSLMGPLAHMYFLHRFQRRSVITFLILAMCIGSIGLLIFGKSGVWAFTLFFMPVCFCGSALRAPSTILLMESVSGDNGIVAALISFGALLCGCIGMTIAALPVWPDYIFSVGLVGSVVSGAALAGWLFINWRPNNNCSH